MASHNHADALTMATRRATWQRAIGACAFVLALVCIAWLPLAVFDIVPFVIAWPGQSSLRLHAGAAVACLMVAAWGFWER